MNDRHLHLGGSNEQEVKPMSLFAVQTLVCAKMPAAFSRRLPPYTNPCETFTLAAAGDFVPDKAASRLRPVKLSA
jgi:hypothetical protein